MVKIKHEEIMCDSTDNIDELQMLGRRGVKLRNSGEDFKSKIYACVMIGLQDRVIGKIVRVKYPKPVKIEVYVGATRGNHVSNAACMKEELRLEIVAAQLLPPRSR